MTDLFQEPDDATPLAPEGHEGPLQSWITHRRDLNEAEQDNIAKGAIWAHRSRRRHVDGILNDGFVRALHKRMFGEVWSGAGSYRQTERNIGIEAWRIPTKLASLFADVKHWIDHETHPPDEIAIVSHHRLVAIHPFPNGNGRSARWWPSHAPSAHAGPSAVR
jgi:Fic-DOC domain mobile mystery protein B